MKSNQRKALTKLLSLLNAANAQARGQDEINGRTFNGYNGFVGTVRRIHVWNYVS